MVLGVRHHPQELLAVLDLGTGQPFIGVQADKGIPGALGIFREELLLGLQTVELVFFLRGDTAVSGDVHRQTSLLKSKRSIISI